jgi:hypothetical protein
MNNVFSYHIDVICIVIDVNGLMSSGIIVICCHA